MISKSKYKLVYKTGTTPFFPICLMGKRYSDDFWKLIAYDLKITSTGPVVAVIKNGLVHWFFTDKLKTIAKLVLDIFFSSSKYINKIKKREKDISNYLLKQVKVPIESLFNGHNLSQKGQKRLQKIFRYYSDYAVATDIYGFLFQLFYIKKIKKDILSKVKGAHNIYKNKEEIFDLILSSYKKTNHERFLEEVYKFVRQDNINNKEFLNKIVNKYYWLIHDYLGVIIDRDYILNFIQESKEDNYKDLKAQLEFTKLRLQKIKFLKHIFDAKTFRKIRIIQELLYIYNERKKKVISKINIYIRQLILYKFPNYSLEKLHQLYQLSPKEILLILSGQNLKNISKRNKAWVYEMNFGKIQNGRKEFLKLVQVDSKNILILNGQSASKGVSRGKVNIILNLSQISKFRKGDILIAPFTSVSYLPAMKKARAILTETGGLTSHAAIVSRELGVPCIVGIKNLISILNDGDFVEVNANQGIVKIIRK